jgi:hypothetical protein
MSRATTFIFRVQDEYARGQGVANGDRRYSQPGIGTDIGGAATVAGAITQTINNLRDSLSSFARKIEYISPSISRESALGEVRQLGADIYADRRMGESLAALVKVESELSVEFQKFYVDFSRDLVPVVTEILKAILSLVNITRKGYGDLQDWLAVEISKIILWWDNATKEQTEQSIAELKKTQERDRRAREEQNTNMPGLDALFAPLPLPAGAPAAF